MGGMALCGSSELEEVESAVEGIEQKSRKSYYRNIYCKVPVVGALCHDRSDKKLTLCTEPM